MKAGVDESEERKLVEAARMDPSRFGELYERHFNRVYAFIARRVPTRAEAEDLTSDVFHRALANLNRFEWRGIPFAAWLLRIAANAIADRHERSNREVLDPAPEAIEPGHWREAEDGARLARLVADLPENQRRILQLRFAEEKSIREVAREMGRSEGAVKQLQFRALETLRARWEEEHG